MQPLDAIAGNIERIRQRMDAAARTAGRSPDEIRLVAVSKRMPPESVAAAIAAGHRCFGENTLQDAMTKQQLIDDPAIEWHFIGHLQSNKAGAVAESFDWLHTLDSVKLAKKLAAHRPQQAAPLGVLLQVNIARDPAKYGLMPDAVADVTDTLLSTALPGIRLQGLMTIGQQGADDSQRRAEFAALRELAADCATRFGPQHFSELSMGMSDDFELAIAEGATMVRVGSSIFGSRMPAG
jgi:pyridoxal phosphate enzyme (YggS family)